MTRFGRCTKKSWALMRVRTGEKLSVYLEDQL